MSENDEIEKLLSLEIEKKLLERNAYGRNVSYDELVEEITQRSGIPEEKFRDMVELFASRMKELCAVNPKEFIKVLKDMTGADEIDIIR